MHGSSHRQALLAAASLILAGCGVVPGGGVLSGGGGSQTGGRGGAMVIGPGGWSATGGSPPANECGAIPTVISQVSPADVLFVLDASAVMNRDIGGATCNGGCGASSKWAQAVAAVERLVAAWEGTVNMGLAIFPDPGSACAGNGVAVPVGPAHATAIAAAIDARTSANGGVVAGGGAPIRGAVDSAAAYLAGLTDPGPKAILLATAGAPNCPAGGADTGADDSSGSIQAITQAYSWGIPTAVIGITTPGGTPDGTLDQMAVAGGRARPGSPSYTPVFSVAELTTTLDTLLRINPPCTFSVPPPPNNDGTTSRWDIGVRLDDSYIPQDPSHLNGWDYVDATLTAVQLYGPACQALAVPPHTVSIVFRCGLQ